MTGSALALLSFWPGINVRQTCAPSRLDTDLYPGMVWVPGGTFEMGGDVYPEEGPRRIVSVDGFWMDRTEVTNAQFTAFVAATRYVTVAERTPTSPSAVDEMSKPGAVVFVSPASQAGLRNPSAWWRYVPGANWRKPGGPESSIDERMSYPVSSLAFEDVAAYAKWAKRQLPNEAQWEWASRAGRRDAEDPHIPPQEANTWQGVFPVLDTKADGFAGVAPVGCFAANAFGLHDMIGNLWEWTSDEYIEAQSSGPAAKRRVIKAGSYLCASNYCMRYRSAARQGQEEYFPTSHLGFRTILVAPGPEK
jgi:formylglycine-generating enzyme